MTELAIVLAVVVLLVVVGNWVLDGIGEARDIVRAHRRARRGRNARPRNGAR